jgi:delta-1-pyrroline-5-carboxylate synthetase
MSTARIGSRTLQGLEPEERATCIYTLADLLLSKEKEILEANEKDLAEATKGGLSKPLLSRLSLTSAKLRSLATGKAQHCDNVVAAHSTKEPSWLA